MNASPVSSPQTPAGSVAMRPTETLLLTRQDVSDLLTLDDCMDAVERAFILAAQGTIPRAGVLGFPTVGGGFHIKAAALTGERSYFAAKLNGNFIGNRERFSLPNIQGLIVLCDATNGTPLAVLDSIEITILRTGAATGLAARCLARPDSHVVTVCGCGNQGRVSLRALERVMRIEQVFLWDIDQGAAMRMADEFESEGRYRVTAVDSFSEVTRRSDVVVTCTPSKRAYLGIGNVVAGAFVAAVGADNGEKQEIGPDLMARSVIVVDSAEQCVQIGDLHHAISAGAVTADHIHAELGQILSGARPGRRNNHEIIVFDSTGTALQDVAAAALVYERAMAAGRGVPFRFAP